LRRESGGNSYDVAPVFSTVPLERSTELAPSFIEDRAVQTRFLAYIAAGLLNSSLSRCGHRPNPQVFYKDAAVFGRELVGSLVAKIQTAISDTLEHAANRANRTPSAVRGVLLTGQTPVQPSQVSLFKWTEAHEREGLAVAGRDGQDHTAVDANRRQAVRSNLGNAILDTERDVPLESASLDCDVADDSA
jgi:hypothetical protein